MLKEVRSDASERYPFSRLFSILCASAPRRAHWQSFAKLRVLCDVAPDAFHLSLSRVRVGMRIFASAR